MIRPEEAWARLALHLLPLDAEEVPRRAALGRVLAGRLVATVDVPFADVSAMDGYALGPEADTRSPIPVAFTVAAGAAEVPDLAVGLAARIMTGAMLPRGADRVVAVEGTDRGLDRVLVHDPPPAGHHVRRGGEVHRRGDVLLGAGTRLGPAALALAATHGASTLPVVRRPTVAILPTGDEVVPPESVPGPGQLRDSHTDFLLAALATLGIAGTPLGIARDEPDDLRAHIRAGLDHDVLLLGGGVSAGAFDLVEGTLAELGVQILVDAVAVQPGKPLVIGVLPREGRSATLVFGLPGNPASVMVSFWLFVRPSLRVLLGHADDLERGFRRARLAGACPGASGRDRMIPARVETSSGELLVTPVSARGSHDLAAFARAEALVRARAGSRPHEVGEEVDVLLLP